MPQHTTAPSPCQDVNTRGYAVSNIDQVRLTLRLTGTLEELLIALFNELFVCRNRGGRGLPRRYEDEKEKRWCYDLISNYARITLMYPTDRFPYTIRVTHANNVPWYSPLGYHTDLALLHSTLLLMGITYHIQYLEIAIDTKDHSTARALATTVRMPWSNISKRFNYHDGIWQPGGAPDGMYEILHFRSDARQLVVYVKLDRSLEARLELRLRRPYLRRRRIHTIQEVFNMADDLIHRNLQFMQLDWSKLNRRRPKTRKWNQHNLTNRSFLEQVRRLMRYLKLSREKALSFFSPIQGPCIDMSLFTLLSESTSAVDHISVGPKSRLADQYLADSQRHLLGLNSTLL